MDIFILGGARTPSGSYLGSLSSVSAPELGAVAISGALEKANIKKENVDEVAMGHVVQAGTGQAPARQAALFAGLPESTPSTTVNKVCGSGMKTIIMGAQAIKSGDADIYVAGGMENMSLAPHLIPNSRTGLKFGQVKLGMRWPGMVCKMFIPIDQWGIVQKNVLKNILLVEKNKMSFLLSLLKELRLLLKKEFSKMKSPCSCKN